MKEKSKSLLFRFAIIFAVFNATILILSGAMAYKNQMNVYKNQKLNNLQMICEHLSDMLTSTGIDFTEFQDYYSENREKLLVPLDLSSAEDARIKWETLFSEKYPGKCFGKDISFSDLSEDAKLSYALYFYEFYLLSFEKICKTFNVAYTYYFMADPNPSHIIYMFDGVRIKKEIDGTECIFLGREAHIKRREHPIMWEAWESGKRPSGFDTWDNEYGHDYSCYVPLFIDGNELGIIGAEVEVSDANKEIIENTLRQISGLAIILIFTAVFLLVFVNRFYISRMTLLQNYVKEYASLKNPRISDRIEKNILGNDEITSLADQVASMIRELEEYMKNLLLTTKELSDTKKDVEAMNQLANRDSLTGIRNKNAYDAEVIKLKKKISDGEAEFGLCMIDLNFLKRTNDTYGHDKGDLAIIKLCRIVCKIFSHSPVFRIGGDEFVVILENSDYKNAGSLINEFQKQISFQDFENKWEEVSAAFGIAFYNPEEDDSVESVFRRADKAMYENKKQMKALRED